MLHLGERERGERGGEGSGWVRDDGERIDVR